MKSSKALLGNFRLLTLLTATIASFVLPQVQAQRTSTASPTTTFNPSGSGGTRLTTPGTAGNGTADSNASFVVNNITQLRVVNEDYLKVYLFPTEKTLEVECYLNLSRWKQTAAGRSSSSDDKLVFRLGFERVEEDSLIDIVSTSLDNANVGEGSRNSPSSSSLKDSFWNPEAGTITLDEKQDYKLQNFNANESKQFFSIKYTRPWLSCDGQDIQFTLAGMKLYWTLTREEEESSEVEYGNTKINSSSVSGSGSGSTHTQAGNPTLTSTTRSPSGSSPTTSRSRTGNEGTRASSFSSTLSPGSESGSSKGNATDAQGRPATTTTRKPKPIKTFKDYKFVGPVTITLRDLFQNFTYMQIKGCGSIFTTIYQCTYPDYKGKAYLSSEESPFFIVKAIHQPNATEVGKSIEIDGKMYKLELCPNERFSFKGWSQGRVRGKGRTGASTQKKNGAVAAVEQSSLIAILIHSHSLVLVVYSSLFRQ